MTTTQHKQFNFSPHPDFRLNGNPLNGKDLKLYAEECKLHGEAFEQEVGAFLTDFMSNSLEIEVFTSGSTGRPKQISLDKNKMINSAEATGAFFKLPEKTTALLCMPVSYIAGKMMLVRAMVLGWHIESAVPRSNPLDHILKRFDFCAVTPFQLDNSLNRTHLIKKMIVGGGKVSLRLQKRLQSLDTAIFETYGMTETITHVAAREINNPAKKNPPFRAMKDIKFAVDDRNCLSIQAPRLSDRAIQTNDIVELINERQFYWQGRYDRVINSGGVKIFPEQVERKLEAFFSKRFFITGLENDSLGERVVLFVEAEFSEETLSTIRKNIDEVADLEKFERPRKIYFVEKFEETHTGKIHRINTAQGKWD